MITNLSGTPGDNVQAGGYSDSQFCQCQSDSAFEPRKIDWKGLSTGATASTQVNYLNGYAGASFDAVFGSDNVELQITGSSSGITASHCAPGADGVVIFLDGSTVDNKAMGWAVLPKALA